MKIAAAFFAFYMLFLSLAPNFGGHELLKLPTLVAHFYEHKQQNASITLHRFLKMHYTNGNVQDKDHDRDMKLPFKSEELCATVAVTGMVPTGIPVFSFKVYTTLVNKLSIKDVSFISSQTLSCIWQPPKTA